MTLKELIETANNGFPDNYLAQYYDEQTGQPKEGHGDTLAEFIVKELAETFDSTASPWEQVSTAIGVIERAQEDMSGVLKALYQKWDQVG